MKKTLIKLLILLLIPVVVISVLNFKDDYSAEKAFWRINKQYLKIARDPGAIPDASFDLLIQRYENFLKRYQGSHLESMAEIFKGRVYVLKKDYNTAREIFEEVVDKYPNDARAATIAFKHINQIYAVEKDFDNIVKTYERIRERYPVSESGIRAPLDIARIYALQKKDKMKVDAIKAAVPYYNELMKSNPGLGAELLIMNFLSEAHFALGQWEKGVDILRDTLIKFPDPKYMSIQRVKRVVSIINAVSVGKLKNFDRPVEIYAEFIEKYPDHPFRKLFEKIIEKMRLLKGKVGNSSIGISELKK